MVLFCFDGLTRYGDGRGETAGGGLAGGAGLPGSVVAYNQPMPTLSEDTSDPQKLKEQLKNTRAQLEALKAKSVDCVGRCYCIV